ncbi:MAG: hypothetical protein ABSF72_04150 [Candidatus Sulfotelmatobacter sp.]
MIKFERIDLTQDPLSSRRSARFSHAAKHLDNPLKLIRPHPLIAKSRVRPAFCAKPAELPAPIPVTCLWTRCTWLKIRELQMQSFH